MNAFWCEHRTTLSDEQPSSAISHSAVLRWTMAKGFIRYRSAAMHAVKLERLECRSTGTGIEAPMDVAGTKTLVSRLSV
jgi:hypothetical protein